MPRHVATTSDPFEILRYAEECGPATASVVEAQLGRLEAEAAAWTGWFPVNKPNPPAA